MLEVTVAGFEMKTCRNAIVAASSGTISSVQTLIYTTRKYWSKTQPGSYKLIFSIISELKHLSKEVVEKNHLTHNLL